MKKGKRRQICLFSWIEVGVTRRRLFDLLFRDKFSDERIRSGRGNRCSNELAKSVLVTDLENFWCTDLRRAEYLSRIARGS